MLEIRVSNFRFGFLKGFEPLLGFPTTPYVSNSFSNEAFKLALGLWGEAGGSHQGSKLGFWVSNKGFGFGMSV